MPNVLMSYHEYKMKKEQERFDAKQGKIEVESCEKGKNGDKKKRTCENGSRKSTSKSAGSKRAESTETIEKKITIMPNPAAKKGSLASFAFPELHPKKNKQNKEPENLLVLTTTRTDERGRRHSVAVPLIPPPDGEKFEGGYHIERNPITGGARLVPPATEKISSRRLSRSFVKRTNSYIGKDLTTISESNMNQLSGRTAKRKLKEQQQNSVCQANYETGSETSSQPSTSTSSNDCSNNGSRNTDSSRLGVPTTASRSRRHSLQPSMSPLSKDLERLKLAEKSSTKSVKDKDKKSQERRSTSKRRSSKQGFLHFLDLAIAN